MSEQEAELIIQETETTGFRVLKTVEELAELSEVLVKTVTKPIGAFEDHRLGHLIDELGDVQLSVDLLVKKLRLVREVEERINYKRDVVAMEHLRKSR